jgi:DNA-binding MarR family transcriptional regulator
VSEKPADIVLIARAVLQLARRLRAERPNPSVTLSALSLLARLHELGPMPAAALARAERLKPQSLSRLIATLDADGMIAREPDPLDRRALVIAITPGGRRALKRDMDARRDWLEAAIAAELTEAERARLTEAAALMLRLARTR